MDKPFSECTVKELKDFIKNTVDNDGYDWYVMVNERNQTIEIVDPKTKEINSICASKICYR